MITILTATYNRANLLPRAFESLVNQSNQDFEWIIVDDGSQDNTREIVENFKSNFPIRYFKKQNGGKHTAINFGVSKACGSHILILDSDDLLPKDCIENTLNKIKTCPKNIAGIIGRKSDLNNKHIGSQNDFKDFITENYTNITFKYGITGDLTEVFRTNVLQEFPFPEIKGEKFCPEDLVWNRIGNKYSLYVFNKSIYIAEYQEGGLTNTIVKIRMNSPKASMIHYSELASYNIPLKEKIKATINFWRFSFNDKDWGFKNKLSRVNFLYSLVGFPLGFAMYLNDRRKNK
ncbi:glycosyltransferase family 2 protein [Ornithobacterium rhinotracheale]